MMALVQKPMNATPTTESDARSIVIADMHPPCARGGRRWRPSYDSPAGSCHEVSFVAPGAGVPDFAHGQRSRARWDDHRVLPIEAKAVRSAHPDGGDGRHVCLSRETARHAFQSARVDRDR